ncbi:hypothetical protein MMYC01_200869 [Madurella mycetomatis]|uniref:Uncharacterized protein n=1 Tax=Madurella mycetomatis TaxID=100816 RepID=A0A175W3H9_9PEZI|nr:hypothetical protein MMYC01_205110 [Madurella mycetomatis]KXX82720.1 hypothetical protein MMYC01_200869 [Madurella mycetomatis]
MALYDLPEVLADILASRYEATILYQVLSTELGSVLGDAPAFSHMGHFNTLSPSYYDQVEDAVGTYGEYLAGQDHSSPRDVSADYVLHLARIYRTVAY